MTVSVVTVTFNAADTVAEAVQSVIGQKGDFHLDYHIVDGGSDDGTLEQIEPFQDRIAEITTGPDDGLYDAMNRGMARAKGDIIGILNADDRFADERVIADVLDAFKATDADGIYACLLYTSPSPRDRQKSRMPSSA